MFSSFQNITRSVLISILCVLFLIGCSSGGNNTPVVPDASQGQQDITENSASTGQNTHYLLTYSLINIDATNPDDIKAEIIPARVGSVHINILKFLEYAPCTYCLAVVGATIPEPGVVDVNIAITHPFDDLKFTAFDVRGIVMFNGSHVFPASGLTMSDSTMGDGELLNAEGFTRLFNGSTLDMAGDLFSYCKGKMATPTVPNADLNGFIRHITDDPANTRNALYAGANVIRTYRLKVPSAEFILGYAVDASWDIPTADPVTDPMTQLPPTANCIEPWKIEASCAPIADIGSTTLTIDVYDWQGKDTISTVIVECPELFTGQVAATFDQDGAGYTSYEAVVSNDNDAPVGSYKALISAEAVENATSPDWTDLTAYIKNDINVARTGDLIWAKRAGAARAGSYFEYEWGQGITTLSDNSTVVTGTFLGLATFGPGEPNQTILNSAGAEDCFIARYNPDGTLAWVKGIGGTAYDEGCGITTLSDDSIVVTGLFMVSATFGPGEPNQTILTSDGYKDIFIARYNPDSTLAWAKRAGGQHYDDFGKGITTLSDNSTVVVGSICGPATFGPGEPNETVLGTGSHDLFIARYNPDGILVWAKCILTTYNYNELYCEAVCGITALSDNSTVMTGGFKLPITFGVDEPNQTVLTSDGEYDIFIARFNPDGTLAWAKHAGGIEDDIGKGITTLSDNSTVVTGSFKESCTFGPGEPNQTSLTSNGMGDIFIACYSPDGIPIWVTHAGGAYGEGGSGITTLSENSTVITGAYIGSSIFGEGEAKETTLISCAGDIFIARYNPDGSLAWAKSAGGTEYDNGMGITALFDNSTVVTGFMEETATFGPGEPNETVLVSDGDADIFVARYMP